MPRPPPVTTAPRPVERAVHAALPAPSALCTASARMPPSTLDACARPSSARGLGGPAEVGARSAGFCERARAGADRGRERSRVRRERGRESRRAPGRDGPPSRSSPRSGRRGRRRSGTPPSSRVAQGLRVRSGHTTGSRCSLRARARPRRPARSRCAGSRCAFAIASAAKPCRVSSRARSSTSAVSVAGATESVPANAARERRGACTAAPAAPRAPTPRASSRAAPARAMASAITTSVAERQVRAVRLDRAAPAAPRRCARGRGRAPPPTSARPARGPPRLGLSREYGLPARRGAASDDGTREGKPTMPTDASGTTEHRRPLPRRARARRSRRARRARTDAGPLPTPRCRRSRTASATCSPRRGVEPEQRVMIALPDGPDFVGALFGTLKLGAVVVMVNPALPAGEIAALLEYTRARVVVTHRDTAARSTPRRGAGCAGGLIVVGDGGVRARAGRDRPPRSRPSRRTATTPRSGCSRAAPPAGPKAVVQTHRSFVNTTECYARRRDRLPRGRRHALGAEALLRLRHRLEPVLPVRGRRRVGAVPRAAAPPTCCSSTSAASGPPS